MNPLLLARCLLVSVLTLPLTPPLCAGHTESANSAIEVEKARVQQTLAEMKAELDKIKTKVQAAWLKTSTLRQELEILDPDPESANVLIEMRNSDSLASLLPAHAAQSVRVAQLSARCEQLAKLPPDELTQAFFSLKIEDPVLTRALPRLAEIDAELAALHATHTPPADPRVVGLIAQKETYEKKVAERRDGILRGERSALKVEQSSLAAFDTQLAELRKSIAADKAQAQKYYEAKAEYLMARSLMQVIEQRYAATRFDSSFSGKAER